MRNLNTSAIIILILFFGSIAFYCYEAIKTPYFNPFSLLVPVTTFAFLFMFNYMEWNPLVRLPNFITDSGVCGTVVGVPELSPGNRCTYRVAVFNRYVPTQKKEKMRGLEGFTASLSGTTIIPVTSHVNDFVKVNPSFCDAPEGAIRFIGKTLNGTKIPSEHDGLIEERDYLRSKLSEVATIAEKAKAVSIASSQEQNIALQDAMLSVITLVKDIESSKNQYPAERGGRYDKY